MLISNLIGIVADDLTGSIDTALEFFTTSNSTKILLNEDIIDKNPSSCEAQTVCITTESRNMYSCNEASENTKKATSILKDRLNTDFFYKKIDSTLRGNIACEILSMLNKLNWDACVVVPSFPSQGRTTVGSYHLLFGLPIERSQIATDPHCPINESFIPGLIQKQLKNMDIADDIIGTIQLKTILKGAGPILLEMNKLIEGNKKIIITDAVTDIDIEQIVLAIEKSNFNILPCGCAAAAKALRKIWLPEDKNEKISLKDCCGSFLSSYKHEVPVNDFIEKTKYLPKLIISGSATKLTASQIYYLKQNYSQLFEVKVSYTDILNGLNEQVINNILKNLQENKLVIVHTCNLISDVIENHLNEHIEKDDNDTIVSQFLFENELTKEEFFYMISNYLAKLTKIITQSINTILILVGGQTSYACCNAISSNILTILTKVCDSVALCQNENNQFIVTKSGNLGKQSTLFDIVNFFKP